MPHLLLRKLIEPLPVHVGGTPNRFRSFDVLSQQLNLRPYPGATVRAKKNAHKVPPSTFDERLGEPRPANHLKEPRRRLVQIPHLLGD